MKFFVSCNTFLFYPENKKKVLHRSRRPEVFWKKVVLRNFTKLAGQHLCQSIFFDKVVGLLRTPIFTEHLRWQTLITTISLFLLSLFVFICTFLEKLRCILGLRKLRSSKKVEILQFILVLRVAFHEKAPFLA